MRLMIETLAFRMGEGEVEVKRRSKCRSCGIPIAHTKRGRVNQDGSLHKATCSHLYGNRRNSDRQWMVSR